MIVTDLRIRNFRNYETAAIRLSPTINLISGPNAQGKTNLLESLVYLSLTRSFRTMNDSLLIRSGCEFANLACVVHDQKDIRLDAVIHSSGKTLSVNRSPVKKTSEFVGLLNTVLFSPDDLGIFLDAPRDRRRLLDQEITKVSSGYLFALKGYRSLLKDRNSLLKQFHPDESYLEVLEERMADAAASVIRERRAFVQSVNRNLTGFYQKLALDPLQADLNYHSCIPDEVSEEGLKDALVTLFAENRAKDIEFKSTGNGIHREDISFSLNGENVINSASQGQKRMVLLGFKLAIIRYIEETKHTRAVLLLDDVLSELDRERQKTLMALIQQPCQCVITGTEFPDYLKTGDYREFCVEEGTITGGNA